MIKGAVGVIHEQRVESFILGKEHSPKWFADKVQSTDIDFEYRECKLVGVRYYDTRGRERTYYRGQRIFKDSLYDI